MRIFTNATRSIISVTALCACTTTPPETTRLDSSGLTVVTQSAAILLARPVRTLAAGARDYAYIGPVEINRMGNREYYFWIGLASTIDRELSRLEPPEALALALLVDDEPMVLPLSHWHVLLDEPLYESTAPIYATLAAYTSLDQIHRIAAAESVQLHIVLSETGTARYRPWVGSWSAWSDFPGVQ